MNGAVLLTLALAVGIPPLDDPKTRVHDFAGVLPADVRQSLEIACRAVERDTTAQLAIVTVNTLEGKSIDDYATELFNQWGIGDRDRNNGVLLLTAPRDRKVVIRVGRGLEPLLTDAACGDILDEYVVPHFRKENIPAGIEAGAKRLGEVLREHPEAARGVPGSAPRWVRSARTDAVQSIWASGLLAVPVIGLGWWARRNRGYSKIMFLLVAAVTAAVVVGAIYFIYQTGQPSRFFAGLGGAGAALGGATWFNVARYRRYGPHACPHCGSRQVLLDEQADDEKLTETQRLEEKLGALDYDVWYCPACLKSETSKYYGSSAFSECPKCRAHTMKQISQKTLYPATSMTDGLIEIINRCMACEATTRTTKLIPKPTSSSSGSGFSSGSSGGGSSFGGGSSGGGGASRSW